MANQAVVSGSACASGRAPARNEASSSSLPGLASSVTSSPTVTIAISSVSAGIRPQGGQVHVVRGREADERHAESEVPSYPPFRRGGAGVLGSRQPRPDGRALLLSSFSGVVGLADGEASPRCFTHPLLASAAARVLRF